MSVVRHLLALSLMVLAVSAPRQSAAEAPVLSDHNPTAISLLPGWLRPDGLYVAAIEITLAPGWKTYWREPGPAGIPPQFDWSGSQNLGQIGYFWPTPTVFDTYGTRTIGYAERLILPVLLRPQNPDQPINIHLNADYGVCEEICVPAYGEASATLLSDAIDNKSLITDWIDRRARPGTDAGLIDVQCQLKPSGEDFILSASLSFRAAPQALEAVVVETSQSNVWISQPDHRRDGTRLHIEADLQSFENRPLLFKREALRFTLIGADTALDIRGCS